MKYRQQRSSTAMTASVRTCAGGIEAGRAPSAMVVAPQPMMNGSRCTRRRTQWSADFSGSGSAASPAMLATVIAARRGGPIFQSRFAGARVPSLSAQIGPLMPGPGEDRADAADIVPYCHIRVTGFARAARRGIVLERIGLGCSRRPEAGARARGIDHKCAGRGRRLYRILRDRARR